MSNIYFSLITSASAGLLFSLLSSYGKFDLVCFFFFLFYPPWVISLIRTEGALRLPTTYNNKSHPIRPSVGHIALNELNRPKIDLSRPQITSNDYQ